MLTQKETFLSLPGPKYFRCGQNGGVCLKKSEPILQKIPTNETETMRTKFCGNYFLGKGFRKTS
ncbi:MAG: hypothetical protein WC437_05060, partial [Patescibacteria group bacterium]